ncbi:folate-binding protein [Dyella jiangningensis]|uniref:CAF17-like 4Fe-4S cluster assembly/insertion protein YgfZ n=1 Tax=Dyella jiangningensis TaxID=1379159 RepID=UPI00240F622B|nr:folate-binding protein [Dyella jiangningensis]MDG2537633.1 folate-binding protein [Dyella jiangningensis]
MADALPSPRPLMVTHHSAQTLSIEGADAVAFAQSQFTSDVQALAVGQWQFSAWLDAQGRVLAFFHLARVAEDALLLLLRGGDAAAMAQSLQRYVFRAKARLTALAPRHLGTGQALNTYAVAREGDAYRIGCGDHSLVIGAERNDEAWQRPQVVAGWPWLPENVLGTLLPPALSFERLQAVSFAKGCYPGQEIVARLHYRGGHKRHMHCVVLSQYLTGGTLLRHGDDGAVQLLDVAHDGARTLALAVIDDQLATSLQNSTFDIADEVITMHIEKSWPA